jgi:maleate cis-trans isomerase
MADDDFPERKIGCLSPRTVIDNHAYEFYRMAPPGVMLVMVSCGLEEFSLAEVERVFKPLEKLLDLMMERSVDLIAQTGIPLPALIGPEAHDKLLARIEKHTKIHSTSDLHAVIAALKHLKAKKVVMANKWSDEMNASLAKFMKRDGMEVVGISNKSLSPREFSKIEARASAQLAYDLGAAAFDAHPDADALFIGGGNWLSQPVCEKLEKVYNKPVICNIAAEVWHDLRHFKMWKPMPGRGMLLGAL